VLVALDSSTQVISETHARILLLLVSWVCTVTDMAKALYIQVLPHVDAAFAHLTAFALHVSMHLCISHECNNIFDFFLCVLVYA